MSPTASLPPNPDPALNAPITPELIERHGLTPEEYERVQTILGREPTLTELGVFSVMWSEHCSYKNSKPLLKKFPVEKADRSAPGQVLVKAGEENAGVVDMGDGLAVCFKIESHNHPSAVEPFEGAATGVGGILRDIFTMGARPILTTNSLRFGELSDPTVQRLFRGVVHGIAHYGNCMGIPNVAGDVYFDPCYAGNPLVNALALGVVRTDGIQRGAASGVGNPVYYVGAATGRDGMGGASFASKDLTEESAADRSPVQKGDPFMEKLLMEACLEMMAVPGLVVGIQDMGAAGLTCSTCETASRGGSGIVLDLDKVPQRETGMNSYEMLLSESQERMLVIVQKGREKEVEAIFEKWDLHAVSVGEVTEGGDMVVLHKGVEVARIPAAPLADEAPVYEREAKRPAILDEHRKWSADTLPDLEADGVQTALEKLLADPTIASKEWVYRQYDHMVGHGTVLAPGSDAAVVRYRDEESGTEKLIAIANDCNHRYCAVNPRVGGQSALAECLRNLACSGARPLAVTDNLNFGNPHNPEAFYMLKECVEGLAEACAFFDTPVCGGNVSLYNQNAKGAIDPTPTVSVAGVIDDPACVTKSTVAAAGLEIVLLGGLPQELGASVFLQVVHGQKTGDAPALDMETELRLHDFLRARIARGEVSAAHDLSEGGLLVAVAEMLFAEGTTFGADLHLDLPQGRRLDASLFGESQSRALVAVDGAKKDSLLAAAKEAGVPAVVLGTVTDEATLKLRLQNDETFTCRWDSTELRRLWSEAIPSVMDPR